MRRCSVRHNVSDFQPMMADSILLQHFFLDSFFPRQVCVLSVFARKASGLSSLDPLLAMSTAPCDEPHTPSPENEPFAFEGPEKNLELDLVLPQGDVKGARAISREQWDLILDEAQCKILTTATNG